MSDAVVVPCSHCQGVGKILVDEHTVRPCVCLLRQMNKLHLGPDLWSAPYIKSSPLFELSPVAGEAPLVDLTEHNVCVKGRWQALRSHLKLALGCKRNLVPAHRWRLVTDEKLLRVWLGAESYTARPKKQRDQQETNNSLADLIGPEIHLVLIALGRLGHKNIAMAGILKEALMIREQYNRATWLIVDPEYGMYGPGHLSYSEDTAEYIDKHFDVVDLLDASMPVPTQKSVYVEDEALEPEDVGLDTPLAPTHRLPPPERPVTFKEDSQEDTGEVAMGSMAMGALGMSQKPKYKQHKGSKR